MRDTETSQDPARPAVAAEPEEESRATGSASKRLLLVDDEPFVVRILSRILEPEDYECDTANSAEEALDKLEAGDYSLVISDINMPRTSGIELLSEIREHHPDVAVIMVTAVDDRATAIRTLQLGAYGYVIKPFDQNEVIINVANALERRRLVRLANDYAQRLEAEVRERTADIRLREQEIAIRLVTASEYRDEETGAHIRRIGMYAKVMARALGWSEDAIEEIGVAAPMHDVGKIGVPDQILQKPGQLTDEEFEIMKGHTTIGAQILGRSDIPLLQMAQEIALTHHEKWDGSGYPRGLAGEEIPESGRIVAVIDVYDSLVHDRVYRAAMPEDKALQIIQDGRGSHFEPRIHDLFLEVLPELRRIRESVHEEDPPE